MISKKRNIPLVMSIVSGFVLALAGALGAGPKVGIYSFRTWRKTMTNARFVVRLILLTLIALLFTVNPATAQEEDPEFPPGWTQGIGTHFSLPDSPYLPVTLDSSVTVTLTLSSVPKLVDLFIHADSSAGSSLFTFAGFEANKLYYRYMDDNADPVTFTTDAYGSFTYTQDLTQSHHIWFQDQPSTIHLRDNPTGGDCVAYFGSVAWTPTTKTCRMTHNVTNTFWIRDPSITLDGNGYVLAASGLNGVYASGVSGVTVMNMNIVNAATGIYLENGTDLAAINNSISNASLYGIWIRGDNLAANHLNDYLTVKDNDITANSFNSFGIVATWGDNLTVEGNTISGSYWGVTVQHIDDYLVTRNIVTEPGSVGMYLFDFSGNPTATIDRNTISASSTFASSGIYLDMRNGLNFLAVTNNSVSGDFWDGIRFRNADNWKMTNNTISNVRFTGLFLDNNLDSNGSVYNNNFINNPVQIRGGSSLNAIINRPAPIGGNYFSNFSTPAQGCFDSNSDSFCDSPYTFGGRDELPWTMQDGWLAPSDTTPPSITPDVSGTPGSNGWYTGEVTVSWIVSDPESPVSSISGCGTTTITADTAGITLTCTVTSEGGTASENVTIKRDATAPTVSASVEPVPNTNGWHNTNVTVSFSGDDGTGSGMGSCDADVVLTSEGAGQSASGACTDLAGNVSAPATASGINIDKTAPVVTVNTPQLYDVRSLGTALDFTASDALSGMDGQASATLISELIGSVVVYSGYVPDPGVYSLAVVATDLAGNMTTVGDLMLVIYDPSGGFVTGGGWIMSPEGAYIADPSLTGKANFGFVSKYKRGADVPTGQTEFQFKVGGLNFHSNSYEWLVVAGQNKAKYKGTGTVNGTGNYGFMLTATDNGNGGDTYRIKIWDIDNGEAVVYDNQMGADDDSYDGTVIGGGNIKVHK